MWTSPNTIAWKMMPRAAPNRADEPAHEQAAEEQLLDERRPDDGDEQHHDDGERAAVHGLHEALAVRLDADARDRAGDDADADERREPEAEAEGEIDPSDPQAEIAEAAGPVASHRHDAGTEEPGPQSELGRQCEERVAAGNADEPERDVDDDRERDARDHPEERGPPGSDRSAVVDGPTAWTATGYAVAYC